MKKKQDNLVSTKYQDNFAILKNINPKDMSNSNK